MNCEQAEELRLALTVATDASQFLKTLAAGNPANADVWLAAINKLLLDLAALAEWRKET